MRYVLLFTPVLTEHTAIMEPDYELTCLMIVQWDVEIAATALEELILVSY